MKVACVVGARPQFIKLASLSPHLRKSFKEIIIHTGQHYDDNLSRVFFKQLEIPEPDYNLEVGSGEHGEQTGKMLSRLEEVLQFENPDLVVVFGDTNSTLAGALTASKLGIKLAHIEAGMRAYDKKMPEEINRVVTDHLSDLLFCPTKTSVQNLKKEGITKNVFLVGDLMYETLLNTIKKASRTSKILSKLSLRSKDYYLVTIHRAENTDNKKNLTKIVEILSSLDKITVFPVHPRTEKMLGEFGLLKRVKLKENLIFLPPVTYLDMLWLEKNAKIILTDSGGVQREAFLLSVPSLILRDRTEWKEIVENGFAKTTGLDSQNVKKTIFEFSKARLPKMRNENSKSPSKEILKVITEFFSN